jgi:hypothetical protein
MPSHYATRSTPVRPLFEVLTFSAGTRALPLHVHVRRWTSDGTVASLLVYAPTRRQWWEGDAMPPEVRAFAVNALAVRIGRAPVFAFTSGVRS